MEFTKMSGTGNDFIVIDSFHRSFDIDWPRFARTYCPRKISVGADGVLVLSPSDVADFTYRIFNADGSEAEMCGNGARCRRLCRGTRHCGQQHAVQDPGRHCRGEGEPR